MGRLDQRKGEESTGFYPKHLRFASHDVSGFTFLAGRCFCPRFLQTHVHGRVHHRATLDLSAAQKHELAFVKDALGRHLRFVVHRARSIDRIGEDRKINLPLVGRGLRTAPRLARRASPTGYGNINSDAEVAEPDFNDFTVGPPGRHFDVVQIQFDADAAAFEPEAGHRRRAVAQKRVQHQVAFVRRGQQAAFHQSHEFLRGVFAERLLTGGWSGESPDR